MKSGRAEVGQVDVFFARPRVTGRAEVGQVDVFSAKMAGEARESRMSQEGLLCERGKCDVF